MKKINLTESLTSSVEMQSQALGNKRTFSIKKSTMKKLATVQIEDHFKVLFN